MAKDMRRIKLIEVNRCNEHELYYVEGLQKEGGSVVFIENLGASFADIYCGTLTRNLGEDWDGCFDKSDDLDLKWKDGWDPEDSEAYIKEDWDGDTDWDMYWMEAFAIVEEALLDGKLHLKDLRRKVYRDLGSVTNLDELKAAVKESVISHGYSYAGLTGEDLIFREPRVLDDEDEEFLGCEIIAYLDVPGEQSIYPTLRIRYMQYPDGINVEDICY